MAKCAACGAKCRKRKRALVLQAFAGAKRGMVCDGCARLGWLIVLGDMPDRSEPLRGLIGGAPIKSRPTIDTATAKAQLNPKGKVRK